MQGADSSKAALRLASTRRCTLPSPRYPPPPPSPLTPPLDANPAMPHRFDWLSDEVEGLADADDVARVEALWEAAVGDYLSVPLWVQYLE